MAAPPLALQSKLEAVLGQREELLISYLIDGSWSMKSSFEQLRETLLLLIEKVGPGVTSEIIQFATTTQIVCPWTSDIHKLTAACQKPVPASPTNPGKPGMAHLGGGTDMVTAFEELRLSFMRVITETARPVVIFITDGAPDRDPSATIRQFLSITPRPTVVGVGIGEGIDRQRLEALLPGEAVFSIDTFAQLASMIKLIASPVVIPHEDLFDLQFKPFEMVQSSTEPLHLRWTLRALMATYNRTLPPGVVVTFSSNPFYFGESFTTKSPAGDQVPISGEVFLKVRPEGQSGRAPIPEMLKYTVTIPPPHGGIFKGELSLRLAWLTKDFLDTEPYNIMVCGAMGSGKTSLINGIANLWGVLDEIESFEMTFRCDSHVTTKYSCTPISNYIDENSPMGLYASQHLKLKVWDTWGITPTTYNHLTLRPFLRGQIWDQTEMPENEEQGGERLVKDPDHLAVIHAVIFVLPIGAALSDGKLKSLEKHIATVLQRNIRPVVVVTYAGTVENAMELDRSFQHIVNASKLTRRDCFLIDNYIDERFRNMSKDIKYWDILKAVLSICRGNWRRFPEQRQELRPPNAPVPGESVLKRANFQRSTPAPAPVPMEPPATTPRARQEAPSVSPKKPESAPFRPTSSTLLPEVVIEKKFGASLGSVIDVSESLNLASLRGVAKEQEVNLDGYFFHNRDGLVKPEEECRILLGDCLDANRSKVFVSANSILPELSIFSQSHTTSFGSMIDTEGNLSLAQTRDAIKEQGLTLPDQFQFVDGISGKPLTPTEERSRTLQSIIISEGSRKILVVWVNEGYDQAIVNDSSQASFSVKIPSSPDTCKLITLREVIEKTQIAAPGSFVFVSQTNKVGYTIPHEKSLTISRIALEDRVVHFKNR